MSGMSVAKQARNTVCMSENPAHKQNLINISLLASSVLYWLWNFQARRLNVRVNLTTNRTSGILVWIPCHSLRNSKEQPECLHALPKTNSQLMTCSGMWRRVILARTDISEESIASMIRVTRIGDIGRTLVATINWSALMIRRYDPPKRRFLQDPRGVTFQKATFFIVTAVKTSNLT
jgi:hypothetical protein